MKIKVNHVEQLLAMLYGVANIVPGCEFNCNKDFTEIRCTNKIVRTFFTTNSITCESDYSFCINDISKFTKLLQMVKTYDNVNSFEMNSSTSILKYDGKTKFNLRLTGRDILEKYMTENIKSILTKLYSFNVTYPDFKNAMGYFSAVMNEESKIYICKDNNGIVYFEIDNKQIAHDGTIVSNVSNIKIPVSSIQEEDFKTKPFDKIYAMNVQPFKDMFILSTDVLLELTKEGAIIANSKFLTEDNLNYTQMKMFAPLLKIQ